jgi:hypothetical protein
MTDRHGASRNGNDPSALRARIRELGHELDQHVQQREDEALADYEARRVRLDNDLTGALPDDSPEPA